MIANDNAAPAVSIVVPCRNERDHIETVLQSILAQDPPPGDFEVIVADGMSDDGTREILARISQEDSRLRVIDNPERIIPTGLNASIRTARGRIVVRMDAHSEYAPDYVQQCVAVLNETGADSVGGPWVAEGKGLVGQAIAAASQSAFSVGGALAHQSNYEGPLDTVYLGCWPVDIFNRVGLFDEELVRSEDDEFNLRLTRTGGKVWQSPRIKSWYHPRESFRSLFQQQMQYGYWKVRVIQKHRIPASVRHLVPASFLLSLILLALGSFYMPRTAWSWLFLVATYLICNFAAAFLTAGRAGWKIFPVLPIVFVCYHFAYGYGFIRGICDFIIFRRRPSEVYTELTRTPASPLPKNTATN